MKITAALENVTETRRARTELGLSSTKGIDSMRDMTMSDYLSHQGAINFQGKEVKRWVSARLGDHSLLGFGQWSQYLHNVKVNPPRICSDLWTQKSVWLGIFSFTRKTTDGGQALGFGEADLQI